MRVWIEFLLSFPFDDTNPLLNCYVAALSGLVMAGLFFDFLTRGLGL